MKTIARFTTRLQGENDGLFIGVLFKKARGAFKPNTVYEIREILGQEMIVEVGPACGSNEGEAWDPQQMVFHWANEIGNILSSHGDILFLTREERANASR